MKNAFSVHLSVSKLPNNKVLYVDISDQSISIDKVVYLTEKYTDFGKALKVSKVLIDMRGSTCLSGTYEKYKFAHTIARQVGLGKEWKIAFVTHEKNRTINTLENAMYSAGYSFMVFEEPNEALLWLEGKTKKHLVA